jgi:hypothetical protein
MGATCNTDFWPDSGAFGGDERRYAGGGVKVRPHNRKERTDRRLGGIIPQKVTFHFPCSRNCDIGRNGESNQIFGRYWPQTHYI